MPVLGITNRGSFTDSAVSCKLPHAGTLYKDSNDMPWCTTSASHECMDLHLTTFVLPGTLSLPTHKCKAPCTRLRSESSVKVKVETIVHCCGLVGTRCTKETLPNRWGPHWGANCICFFLTTLFPWKKRCWSMIAAHSSPPSVATSVFSWASPASQWANGLLKGYSPWNGIGCLGREKNKRRGMSGFQAQNTRYRSNGTCIFKPAHHLIWI